MPLYIKGHGSGSTFWGKFSKLFYLLKNVISSVQRLEILSLSPVDTCKYLGYHFWTLRATLKIHPKMWILTHAPLQAPKGQKSAKMSHFDDPRSFFASYRVKNMMKHKNNIKNVFSNL